MSLVENIARRNPRPREMLEAIRVLKNRGHEVAEIARKTALDHTWVRGILTLLEKGEERLISAVDAGRVPIATAIEIVRAGDDDAQIQAVMQSAYESGALRGKKLLTVRKLIEKRRLLGKAHQKGGHSRNPTRQVSSSYLIRAYNQEVERQKQLIRKADFMETDVFNANATQVSSLPKAPVGAPTASPAPADDDASGFFTDDPPPRR
jgi:ParB family chromosome partitioning protein